MELKNRGHHRCYYHNSSVPCKGPVVKLRRGDGVIDYMCLDLYARYKGGRRLRPVEIVEIYNG